MLGSVKRHPLDDHCAVRQVQSHGGNLELELSQSERLEHGVHALPGHAIRAGSDVGKAGNEQNLQLWPQLSSPNNS